MDNDALNDSPIGRLVTINGSHMGRPFACFAYLANPLPDSVDLDLTTWSSIVDASAALARLDQECKRLPNPQLLIRPALWREALDTSALEGTFGQLSDLLELELPGSQFRSPESLEIAAYVDTANHAFTEIRSRPLSVGLLCEFQSEMFKASTEKPSDLGKIRTRQVWIGEKDKPVDDARFVPAPGNDLLKAGLEHWIEWIESDNGLPPVLRAAMAHYQFETLHPFSDGNGRIGRLVIILQFLRSGVIRDPAITVSPWFLRNKLSYQDHLLNLSVSGDWNPWVQFFCRALSDQCVALINGAESLAAWLSNARALVVERRWGGSIHQVVNDLAEWPVLTIASTSQKYDLTKVAAARVIEHLCEVGILKELTGGDYRRVYGASTVMDIVNSI